MPGEIGYIPGPSGTRPPDYAGGVSRGVGGFRTFYPSMDEARNYLLQPRLTEFENQYFPNRYNRADDIGGGGSGTSGGGTIMPTATGTTPGTVAPFNWQNFFPSMNLSVGGDRKSLENALLAIASATAGMDAAQRNAVFSLLFPELTKMIQGGGEGFRPDELATMRANAIDTTATQFGGAQSALKEGLRKRGLFTSGSPMAGAGVRDIALLGSEQAKATSGALRDIDLKNANQRIMNLFNAMNIAGGHAANPSSAISAGASVAGALQNEPGSLWRSLLGSLTGAAASSAGTALGRALGGLFKGSRTGTSGAPVSIPGNPGDVGTQGWWP